MERVIPASVITRFYSPVVEHELCPPPYVVCFGMLGGEMVGRLVGYRARRIRGNAVGDDERPRMGEADLRRVKKTINRSFSRCEASVFFFGYFDRDKKGGRALDICTQFFNMPS